MKGESRPYRREKVGGKRIYNVIDLKWVNNYRKQLLFERWKEIEKREREERNSE